MGTQHQYNVTGPSMQGQRHCIKIRMMLFGCCVAVLVIWVCFDVCPLRAGRIKEIYFSSVGLTARL